MVRLIRGCATIVGLIVLVAIGIGVYNTFGHSPAALAPPASQAPNAAPTAPAAAPATAPTVAAVRARLQGAESRIRQDAAAGRHEPISMTISDSELNGLVQDALARGEVQAPVTNVSAKSVPGQVNIAGLAHASVLSAPFTMAAVPQVSGGKAQLHVTNVNFNGLPVPDAISSQLISSVSSDNLLGNVPLNVTSFRAEQGRLVLEGTT